VPLALLVDYGEVICEPQPHDTLAQMAALVRLDVPTFVERYWKHRPAYDRGLHVRAYWSAVAGREPINGGMLDELIRLDLDSWSELNDETLEILAEAHRCGASLSLLSNAPHELADLLTDHPALAIFDHLMFSSRLGLVKPDPAVFEAALKVLSREPEQVLFIDDREANVEGARAAGLRAVRFTSPAALRFDLLE
jgi:putative hydrolase of the HAD superfamily